MPGPECRTVGELGNRSHPQPKTCIEGEAEAEQTRAVKCRRTANTFSGRCRPRPRLQCDMK